MEFTDQEFRRLYSNFQNLGGFLSDEFLASEQLASDTLVERLVSLFDRNKDTEDHFVAFMKKLANFSNKESADRDLQLQLAFDIYDIDHDGKISTQDLYDILKAMVGDNLNDSQLQQIVDSTLLGGDKDRDGGISYAEFNAILARTEDLNEKLSVKPPEEGGEEIEAGEKEAPPTHGPGGAPLGPGPAAPAVAPPDTKGHPLPKFTSSMLI